jgi:hypothetical protein
MPNPGPATNIVSNSMAELITVSQPSRTIYPSAQLTALTAPGNGTMSFNYVNVPNAFTCSRVDALVAFSVASSATTNTYGLAITAIAGIYTQTSLGAGTATTLGLTALTTGSVTVSYSVASNTAGVTQLNQSALRNISVPLGFASVYQGEYLVGFAISTNTTSIGLSTTALGQTMSIYGGAQLQTGQNYAVEFTGATATSGGLFPGMGVHSVTQSAPLATYAVSDINATGVNLSAANIALVFRNVTV